jgi:MerR family transcriptional regulator, redox-sensitive transcriptional activator SoxR
MFAIGEAARRAGMRPSAVRYYEQLGLIEADGRVGGKRVFSDKAVERLTLIAFAKQLGFTLAQIRKLLAGFPEGTPAGRRWSALAAEKLAALETMAQQIETMRAGLHRISNCGCRDLEQCARGIAASKCR